MFGKKVFLVVLLLMMALMIAACSGDQPESTEGIQQPSNEEKKNAEEQPKPVVEISNDPVELTWYFGSLSKYEMETYTEPVNRKYPHISLNFLRNEGDNKVENLVVSGTKIDIMYGSFSVLAGKIKENGLLGEDISDLVKRHNFDLTRIDDAYIEMMRDLNDGKLAGLPFFDLRRVLYYNKDIFDRFGVGYPVDGMTWEEVSELAKKLTRQDGGTKYYGFASAPQAFDLTNQYALPYVDPQTNKAAIQTSQWKKFVETYVPLYTMSGYNATKELLANAKQNDLFLKEQTAAMWVGFNSSANTMELPNWDIVTYLEMSDLPKGIGSQPYPVYLALTSMIKPEQRDAAFQVMEQFLSEEVQKEFSADFSLATPLINPEVKAAYGKNNESLKGKNIKAIISQKPAAPTPYHEQYKPARNALGRAMVSVILGEKDVNTALRVAEEEANKEIQEKMSK